MALIVIALAAIVLTGAARMSAEQALKARTASDQLQLRWGIRSIRMSVLPRAERLLLDEETHSAKPIVNTIRSCQLGEFVMTIVIADEQAKVNLNRVIEVQGELAAERAAERVVKNRGIAVRLSPQIVRRDAGRAAGSSPRIDLPSLGSWAQVFDGPTPDRLLPLGMTGANLDNLPTSSVTCWGNGKLNFQRASGETIAAAVAQVAPDLPIDRMIELRDRSPNMDATRALEIIGARNDLISRAESLFVQGSLCHSIWIRAARIPSGVEINASTRHGADIHGPETMSRGALDSGGGGGGVWFLVRDRSSGMRNAGDAREWSFVW